MENREDRGIEIGGKVVGEVVDDSDHADFDTAISFVQAQQRVQCAIDLTPAAEAADVVEADDEYGLALQQQIRDGACNVPLLHIFRRRLTGQLRKDPREDGIRCPVDPAVNVDGDEAIGRLLYLGEERPHACCLPAAWRAPTDDVIGVASIMPGCRLKVSCSSVGTVQLGAGSGM